MGVIGTGGQQPGGSSPQGGRRGRPGTGPRATGWCSESSAAGAGPAPGRPPAVRDEQRGGHART